jgi:hypothetical protein
LDNYEKATAIFEELGEEGPKQSSGWELAGFEEQSWWVVGKD